MALVTPTPITALDGATVPSTQAPDSFDQNADDFLGRFPNLQAQVNVSAQQTNENAGWAHTKAAEAADKASTATAAAAAAAASATAAALSSGAAVWVSGNTYLTNAVAYSPTSKISYRRKAPGGVSTIDPASDYAGWGPTALAAPQYIPVTTATGSMLPNGDYDIKFAGQVVLTMPATGTCTVGDIMWVRTSNGRTDNYINLNGNTINGDSDGPLVLDSIHARAILRYTGSNNWSV